MKKFNAKAFYAVTTAIQHTQSVLEATGQDKFPENEDGGVAITAIADPVMLNELRGRARELQSSLLTLGTRQTSKVAHRLLESLQRDELSYPQLVQFSRDIQGRLQDELEDVALLVLSENERDLFEPSEPLFGTDFQAKFASEAAFEADEAAKCRALGRPTAAVFHLMRTMEIGIRAISRCLDIPDPLRPADRSWGIILRSIRGGIDTKWSTVTARSHGDGALFDSLYASLDAVKNPWRNATMHVEQKKTETEAEQIFIAVKAFMMKLAERCDENGEPKA